MLLARRHLGQSLVGIKDRIERGPGAHNRAQPEDQVLAASDPASSDWSGDRAPGDPAQVADHTHRPDRQSQGSHRHMKSDQVHGTGERQRSPVMCWGACDPAPVRGSGERSPAAPSERPLSPLTPSTQDVRLADAAMVTLGPYTKPSRLSLVLPVVPAATPRRST